MQEWMRWMPDRPTRFGWMLLEPARVIVGIGAAMGVLAGLMPWAEGTAPGRSGFEPVAFSGLDGAGDGVMLMLLAGAIGFLSLHRTPAGSRVRSVRLAPTVLVGLAGATWLTGHRAALAAIDAWGRRGGHGDISLGLWLAAAGILAMAAGSAWLLPPVLRWKAAADDPGDLVTIHRRDLMEGVGGVIGTFLGAIAGISGAVAVTGPTIIGMIALGATFGGLLGAYAGARVARAAFERVTAPRG
jgi:hypothetical protein